MFRLLKSLAKGSLIKRTAAGQYRATIKPIRRSRIRLGYAGQGMHPAVTNSILQAADQEGIEMGPTMLLQFS